MSEVPLYALGSGTPNEELLNRGSFYSGNEPPPLYIYAHTFMYIYI